MREIKFRAWDDENGCFITHERLFLIASYADLFCMKLMQYTGLKDKNGVEIYEGDIIKTNATNAFVHFDKCCFWIEGKNQAKSPIYQFSHYLFEDDHFEIIGNIYENPELLDTK